MRSHDIELAGQGLGAQHGQRFRRNQVGLFEPLQQAFAIVDRVDRFIDGRRHRIQKIEGYGICNEDGLLGLMFVHIVS